MTTNVDALWNALIPITILSIVINIIPFIIHIRLRNRPATFMTLLFVIYGLLTITNIFINRSIPIQYILNLTQTYWFCWIYDIGLSVTKVACTGCYVRLLNRLLSLLQKMAAQQQQQQHHFYQPDDYNRYTTNIIISTIRRVLSAIPHLFDDPDTPNTRKQRRQPWKTKLSQAKNTLALWYQDHHLLLWDVVFIWILPIVYIVLSTSADTHNDANASFDTAIRYMYYSQSMGCLTRNTNGLAASTVYYIYPLLLICVGFLYTVLIAIKIKQLKLYFRGKPAEYGLNRLPFYRLFIFCCLYILLYVIHLPFVIPDYVSVVLHQQIPMQESAVYLSKNGLILKKEKTAELLVIFVYPLLSFFWSLFFGTTQEAYIMYRSVWRWLKNRYCALCGKQRTMDDEGHNNDNDQQLPTQPLLPPLLLPPPEIYLDPTTTVSSHTSTLISATLPYPILSPKTPTSPPADSDTSSYVTAKQRSWLLSLSSTSSLYDDYNFTLRPTDKRDFSSVPCFPSHTTLYTNHSTIENGSTIATGSSVTLVNHRSY